MDLIVVFIIIALFVAIIKHWGNKPSDSHGKAHWATDKEIAKASFFSKSGVILGRHETGSLLRWEPEGHILTVAGTRTGKTSALVIPTLLSYSGNTVVIDVKGENYAVTARARIEMGHKVYRLDPFRIIEDFGINGTDIFSTFNPLDIIDENYDEAFDQATSIAESLVVIRSGEKDPHWNDKAKSLLRDLILYTVFEAPPEKRHLIYVRDILTSSPDEWESIKEKMMESSYTNIANRGREISGLNPTEWNSIISTALRHTDFLESPKIQDILYYSSFSIKELSSGKTTIYLIIPPSKIKDYFRLLRLWVNCALAERMSFKGKTEYPCLFLLDEMAQIKTMDSLYDAISVSASYGITIWCILQNIGQIKSLYPDHKWEAFMDNTGIKHFFGIQHNDTAKYISDMAGQKTIITTQRGSSISYSDSWFFGRRSNSENKVEIGRKLIRPEEVMSMNSNEMIIFSLDCKFPIRCKKIAYYKDKEFKGKYNPNPYHV